MKKFKENPCVGTEVVPLLCFVAYKGGKLQCICDAAYQL